MSKFRIGDVVVINGYVHDRGEYYSFVPEMDKFIGKKAKVRWHNENGDCIHLDVDGGEFAWHQSWLGYPKGRVDIYEC